MSVEALLESAQEQVAGDAVSLEAIVATARQQVAMEAEIEQIEETLKAKKNELHVLRSQTLPAMIQTAGLSSVPLDNGVEIKLSDVYNCGIRKEVSDQALTYLRETGWGDVIKNQIIFNLGMGEDNKAAALLEDAKEIGLEAETKETVHPATLNSLLKEVSAKGIQLPEHLFTTYIGQVTKVAQSKKRK